MHNGHVTLVLGGARSGKSAYAEGLLAASSDPVYVATGQAFDDEMRVRIAAHRDRRPAHWRTVEAPIRLAEALSVEAAVLVDCLTLWVTNLLLGDVDIGAHVAALEAALRTRAHPTVLVSNETGLGIVPGDALSRRFRDEQGVLNQRIAALAGTVVFVAAGLPLVLKAE
jgi:adenosyl cobinamide kinase/adenosyl cobinamide phosphate guanylyltransferase